MATAMTLSFQGFAQARLATDPDPCDEPRGISGWTHAVAGEPDLDRVLVLQEDDPRRVARSPGPTVGVSVTAVRADGVAQPDHVLHGARVELLGEPKFEGRNWIIAADGAEPIDPLHIAVTQGSLRLAKSAVIRGPAGDEVPIYLATPDMLGTRTPTLEGDAAARHEIFDALGITDDPAGWRARRKTAVQAKLNATADSDEVTKAALQRRLEDLDIAGPALRDGGSPDALPYRTRRTGRNRRSRQPACSLYRGECAVADQLLGRGLGR